MHAHFRYELSKDEYVVGLGALIDELGRQDTSRTPRILEQLAIFILVIAVITVVFPNAVMGLLVGTLLLAILLNLFRARWQRGATGQSYDPAAADFDVEITDDALVASSPLRVRRWAWPAVRRIHDLKPAIVLELIGWDMIVLPDRLWTNAEERRAFLGHIRTFAGDTAFVGPGVKSASFDRRDLLTVGAIAAAVDLLAVLLFVLPVHKGPSAPIAAMLLLGAVLAYVAFRLGRSGLARLHDSSPAAALTIAQALIWAVPFYMLITYLGWV